MTQRKDQNALKAGNNSKSEDCEYDQIDNDYRKAIDISSMLLTHSRKWFRQNQELQGEMNHLLGENETIRSTAGINLSQANERNELAVYNNKNIQVELEDEIHSLRQELQIKKREKTQ